MISNIQNKTKQTTIKNDYEVPVTKLVFQKNNSKGKQARREGSAD